VTPAPDLLGALHALPRRPLAVGPTPLVRARALGAALGIPDLWLKRDDLVGFGFGGNKVRGLELLVADALLAGADGLVTGAGPQSNHVRASAAAAAHAGLACTAVFWGRAPAESRGNLGLTRLLGARCVFTGDDDRASVDAGLEREAADARAAGRRPYVIPRGGACALAVLAHARAVDETLAQCGAAGFAPGLVLLAAGSGGTLAGWLLGRALLGARFEVQAVAVSRAAAETGARVRELLSGALRRLGDGASARLGAALAAPPVVHGGFMGEGYGLPTPEGLAAIRLAARTEGVFLDPTYTGKAMAGLAALARRGALPRGPVIFVHTGGEPGLFARNDVLDVPEGATP